MLTSVFVLASVAALVQNVVQNKTTNWKLNESVEVTTTTPETDLYVNYDSTTSNTDIDFLFDEPEEPSVSGVVSPVTYGTGPHWSHETQALYYVSIFGKTLMKYKDGSHFKAKLDGMPTFIIPIEGKMNTFAVGLDQKVVEIQWDGAVNKAKVLRTIAEVHMEHPEDRFSHGKADPRGRLFAGSMIHNNDPARTDKNNGALYRFEVDGTPQKVLDNIDVSNGLCWDLAHKAFYLVDNFNYSIRRYDYDVETGNISNPQIVFAMQDQEYIVANASSDGQVFTQDDVPYDSFEPNNLGGPPIGRQGNTQDNNQGTQGDPQGRFESLEIYKNLGGLLDRDDYYENGDLIGSETDATDGSDVKAPGGSEGVAPGVPGYVKGGPQIRRQGDLQGSAQGGPQGTSQSYVPSGLQDYGQSGVESNGQGGPEVAAPSGSESDDRGSTQGIAHGAPQGASQNYAPSGLQDYGQSGVEGYGHGGPEVAAPGNPESEDPGGSQGIAHGGLQDASQNYAPTGPQDYSQSGPENDGQGGPKVAASADPESDDTGSPQGITHGAPQGTSQSYASSGSQTSTSGGADGDAPGGPDDDAPGGADDDAPGSADGDVPSSPDGHAPGGHDGVAPDGSDVDASDVNEGYAPAVPEIDAIRGIDADPDGFEGVTPGGPQTYVENGPQIGRQNDAQDSPSQKVSQSYVAVGPQNYAPDGSQGYALGGLQSYTPDSLQGYALGSTQGHAPGRPQGYVSNVSQAYAPRGHAPVSPGILRNETATAQDYNYQDLAQDGLQGAPPGGPESNTTGNFLDYDRDGPGPQDQAPGGPLDYGPEDYGFAPGGRQEYSPRSSIRTKGVEKAGSYKKKLSGTLEGMTIDTEGNLWVANYNGSQVLKIDPKKGKLLLVIPVEALLVTSLTFGGDNLDVLYVTSAATDSMDKKVQRSPAGSTFSIMNTGAKGHLNNNVRFTKSIITRSNGTKVDEIID